jgi:pimeloyl-ACP methyl ester carboxylesterase
MVNIFRKEMPRPIVGLGHSMGGCQLTNLALMHPRLFETLVLIDPVISTRNSTRGNWAPAMSSATRRDRWPSRAEALASFKRSKFYQVWDPRVLDLWVKYGLRELPTKLYPDLRSENQKEVTLTTTRYQEVATFLRPTRKTSPPTELDVKATHPDFDPAQMGGLDAPFYRSEAMEVYRNLASLRPSVFYIFGETSDLSTPDGMKAKMEITGTGLGGSGGARAGRVAEILMKGTGHLIPMEKVEETGRVATEWLGKELARWRKNEEILNREWAQVPEKEKYTIGSKIMTVLETARPNKNGNGNGKPAAPKL